jgi:hypothetical protein
MAGSAPAFSLTRPVGEVAAGGQGGGGARRRTPARGWAAARRTGRGPRPHPPPPRSSGPGCRGWSGWRGCSPPDTRSTMGSCVANWSRAAAASPAAPVQWARLALAFRVPGCGGLSKAATRRWSAGQVSGRFSMTAAAVSARRWHRRRTARNLPMGRQVAREHELGGPAIVCPAADGRYLVMAVCHDAGRPRTRTVKTTIRPPAAARRLRCARIRAPSPGRTGPGTVGRLAGGEWVRL